MIRGQISRKWAKTKSRLDQNQRFVKVIHAISTRRTTAFVILFLLTPTNFNIEPSSSVLQHDAVDEDGTPYTVYAKTLTFWEARASCVQEGGILANVHTKHAQEFIFKSILADSHAKGIMEVTPSSHQGKFL